MLGIERFDSKVTPEPTSGCWLWTGSLVCGYGQFSVKSRPIRAHRFAYETARGAVPDDLDLDHLCRNRACCNPNHLEPVTRRVNTLRGVGACATNARKTHCKNGHEFTDENTRMEHRATGVARVCRACERERHGLPRRPV